MSVPAKSFRLDAERIREMREWVDHIIPGNTAYFEYDRMAINDLLSVLDDYERYRDYERKWNELVETTGQRIAQAGGQDGKS